MKGCACHALQEGSDLTVALARSRLVTPEGTHVLSLDELQENRGKPGKGTKTQGDTFMTSLSTQGNHSFC